jgi:hypothetical protein
MAPNGHGEMSDLSPLSGAKQTSAKPSERHFLPVSFLINTPQRACRSSCNFIAAAALVISSESTASKYAARGFPCSSVPKRTVMFVSPSRFLESEVWRVISALHNDKGARWAPLVGVVVNT